MYILQRENDLLKILDATAGYRSMWFDKNYPNTTYIDIRPETKPDFIMDSTKTTFSNKSFDLILFDPPYMQFGKKSIMGHKYGSFSRQYIREFIKNSFKEFNRILKDDGAIIFKFGDGTESLKIIFNLIKDFKPLFGQRQTSSGKPSIYWFYLQKNLDGKQYLLNEKVLKEISKAL